MPWVTQIKATGKIFEMQDALNPKKTDLTIALKANAIEAGLKAKDIEIKQMTSAEYKAAVESDPGYIAAKAQADDERTLGDKKVLLSLLFDMANKIQALEGKKALTKRQFINNLKGRR